MESCKLIGGPSHKQTNNGAVQQWCAEHHLGTHNLLILATNCSRRAYWVPLLSAKHKRKMCGEVKAIKGLCICSLCILHKSTNAMIDSSMECFTKRCIFMVKICFPKLETHAPTVGEGRRRDPTQLKLNCLSYSRACVQLQTSTIE